MDVSLFLIKVTTHNLTLTLPVPYLTPGQDDARIYYPFSIGLLCASVVRDADDVASLTLSLNGRAPFLCVPMPATLKPAARHVLASVDFDALALPVAPPKEEGDDDWDLAAELARAKQTREPEEPKQKKPRLLATEAVSLDSAGDEEPDAVSAVRARAQAKTQALRRKSRAERTRH